MEIYHNGFIIRPIITQSNGVFSSSVVIRETDGTQQVHESIGRFASLEAAKLFAVNWALASINGAPAPKPPFRMMQ